MVTAEEGPRKWSKVKKVSKVAEAQVREREEAKVVTGYDQSASQKREQGKEQKNQGKCQKKEGEKYAK